MKNTFSSIKEANIRKAIYIVRHVTPIFQSNLNLFIANAKYNATNVDNKDIAEYVIPDEFIVIYKKKQMIF